MFLTMYQLDQGDIDFDNLGFTHHSVHFILKHFTNVSVVDVQCSYFADVFVD